MSELSQLQFNFTKAIRSCNDSSDTKLNIYQELTYTSHDDNLKRCFPVIDSLLTEKQWEAISQIIYSSTSFTIPLFL